MLKLVIAILVSSVFGAVTAQADDTAASAAVYYKGEQPVGIAGEVVDCFVEATYSSAGLTVQLRSLVADAHDGETVGVGPVTASYDAQNLRYGYVATDHDEKVQEAFLAAKAPESAEGLSLIILDGSHADATACNKLNILQGAELVETQEKFEHFDDYVEDEDGDHGDDHGHDDQH